MKRKPFLALMGIVFTALMGLELSARELPAAASSVMSFPFEQIGTGLRWLALTGKPGNGLAFLLCTALSVIPVFIALRHKGDPIFLGENIVLCCTGIVVWIALFSMANPSCYRSAFPNMTAELLPIVRGIIGCTVWFFVMLWLVLRLARLFRFGDTKSLFAYLRMALFALCILFDAGIALSCGGALLKHLSSIQQSMDAVMAVLRFLTSALPYALNIVITLSALTLLDAYQTEDMETTVRSAERLSRRCRLALTITAASTVVWNVLQLLLSRFLSDVSIHVDIPVISLAFTLLILLLSRFLIENQTLQSDNDLFI